jgi:hypothetical protein
MSKSKKHHIDTRAITRRAAWEASVAEMREGRRQRAVTFTDRRKEAARRACRGRVGHDG